MKIACPRGLVVRAARNGLGIFTTRRFVSGETVFEVTGPRITCAEDEAIDEETRNNAFRVSAQWYISPQGRVGDYLNHSCDPTCAVRKRGARLFIVAIRTLGRGEELVIDYSTILAADDRWSMRCNCGTVKCRTVIRRFSVLPKTLKDRYIRERLVPAYIRAI